MLFLFGMQDGLRIYILKLDYLSSDVGLSFAVCDLSYKVVINSTTHHMKLWNQMKQYVYSA